MTSAAMRPELRRVALLGTGLIGGSIGLALARRQIVVVGYDADPSRAMRARELGAVSEVAASVEAAVTGVDLVVVAVPVGHIAALARVALERGAPVVTDVGSVKGPIVASVAASGAPAARFVGGHPMAGSEQDGVDGADPDVFVGAAWVLTPTADTDPDAFTTVRTLVGLVGAEAIAVTPDDHDALVALVSHVPQLAASTLMDVATGSADEQRTLLRLAAGGFRDMTRIAAGHPGIWPDILAANRDAVLRGLDDYRDALGKVRDLVAAADRDGLLEFLQRARAERRSLPVGTPPVEELVELRIPVADRSGVIAEVTTLATALGINVYDLEIAHSAEGRAGVLVLVVAERRVADFETALGERGYHAARGRLA